MYRVVWASPPPVQCWTSFRRVCACSVHRSFSIEKGGGGMINGEVWTQKWLKMSRTESKIIKKAMWWVPPAFFFNATPAGRRRSRGLSSKQDKMSQKWLTNDSNRQSLQLPLRDAGVAFEKESRGDPPQMTANVYKISSKWVKMSQKDYRISSKWLTSDSQMTQKWLKNDSKWVKMSQKLCTVHETRPIQRNQI